MIIEICPKASVLGSRPPPPDLPPPTPTAKSGDCSAVGVLGDHRMRVVVHVARTPSESTKITPVMGCMWSCGTLALSGGRKALRCGGEGGGIMGEPPPPRGMPKAGPPPAHGCSLDPLLLSCNSCEPGLGSFGRLKLLV